MTRWPSAAFHRPDHGQFSDSLKTRWPLEDILGIDIIAAAQRRIDDKLKLPTKTEGGRCAVDQGRTASRWFRPGLSGLEVAGSL